MTVTLASERAPAKINLALQVTGRRADGYHLLDTLVVFTELADMVHAEAGPPGSGLSLTITGPMAGGLAGTANADNLVLRAARALTAELGRGEPDLVLTLEKHLPTGAGIGGGSADAAATLRLLLRLWDAELPAAELNALAVGLGADIPMCLLSKPVRATGIGEVLEPVRGLPPLPMVLVNHPVNLPTAAVFARLGPPDDPPLPLLPGLFTDAAETAAWLGATTNGLSRPALALAPAIGTMLQALVGTPGCLLARMSGSGATCFGLFADRASASAAASRLEAMHPNWWVAATESSGS